MLHQDFDPGFFNVNPYYFPFKPTHIPLFSVYELYL